MSFIDQYRYPHRQIELEDGYGYGPDCEIAMPDEPLDPAPGGELDENSAPDLVESLEAPSDADCELSENEVITGLQVVIRAKDEEIRQLQAAIHSHKESGDRERRTINYLWLTVKALGGDSPLGQFMTETFDRVRKSEAVFVDAEAEARKLAPEIAHERVKKEIAEELLPNLVQTEIDKLDNPAQRALMMAQIARDPETQEQVAEAARMGHEVQMEKVGREHREKLVKDAREEPLTRLDIAGARLSVGKGLRESGELKAIHDKKMAQYIEEHRDEIILDLADKNERNMMKSLEECTFLDKTADPELRRVWSKKVYDNLLYEAHYIATRNGECNQPISELSMKRSRVLIDRMVRGLQVEVANDKIKKREPLRLGDLPNGMRVRFEGTVNATDSPVALNLEKMNNSFRVEDIVIKDDDLAKLDRKNLVHKLRPDLWGYLRNLPANGDETVFGPWDVDDLSKMKHLAFGKISTGGTVSASKAKAHDILDIKMVYFS